MLWSQKQTLELINAVDDTDDPFTAACAIIGAMVGVLIHYDGIELANDVLSDFTSEIEIRITRPTASAERETV